MSSSKKTSTVVEGEPASQPSAVQIDLSKPLPTEVMAANNPNARKYGSDGTTMTSLGESQFASSHAAPRLDAENYARWREETATKVANGEDYYADFARRARERSDNTVTGKIVNGIKGVFKSGKKGAAADDSKAGQAQAHSSPEIIADPTPQDGVVR